MTVSNTTNRIPFFGNGITNEFPVSFPFHKKADLVVLEVVLATGNQTVMALNSDYDITGTQDALGHYSNGGTVVASAPPPSTVAWIVYRDPAPIQGLELLDLGPFQAESVEAQLDYQTMLIQRVTDLVVRALRQPDSDTDMIGALPRKADRTSHFAAYDSNGDPIAAAGTSANLGPVSSFMDTLLPSANARDARALLETAQPSPWVQNLKGQRHATTTRYTLTADYVSLTRVGAQERDNVVMRFPWVITPCTIDASVAGPIANGRDQAGAFDNPSFVHLYAIWNPSSPNVVDGIASVAEPINGPSRPSGYTHWAYLTTIRYTTDFQDADASGADVRHEGFQVGTSLTATSLTFINLIGPTIAPNIATGYYCMADLNGVSSGASLDSTLVVTAWSGGGEKPVLRMRLFQQGLTTTAQAIRSGLFYVPRVASPGLSYRISTSSGTSLVASINSYGYTVPNGDK